MLAAAWTRRHVRALDDPFRDGQVVLSRDATRSTMLGWLSTTINGASSRYDVLVDLGAPTYDATTGHRSGRITVTNGSGTAGTVLSLTLDRSSGVSVARCPAA